MKAAIAKGAAWMVLFRLFDRSIGIVSTVVLARVLLPADFGLIAMAMSVIALIELATSFSFDVALIQKKDPTREHYDTAWTLNLLMAAAGAAVTIALAWPAARFYGDPRVTPVMLAIGLIWLTAGFENIGIVNFRRSMDFGREFRLMASKRVISFAVTMIAVWIFRSYWTLVVGMAAGRIAGVALSYAMEPFRPRPALVHARELFSFSGWIVLGNLALVLMTRAPHFVIGRMFGAQSLGAYTVGAEIANLPHTELVAPVNRAMFPGFSRLTDNMDAFRKTCVEATAAIFLLVMPVSVGVALLAPQIVRILLGQKWPEAVPVIQILSFAGAVSALTSNNMSAYQALGKPSLGAVTLVVRMLLLLLCLWTLTARHGVLGAAYAEVIAALGSLAVSVPILARTLGLSPLTYFGALLRPMIASALMGLALHAVLPGQRPDAGVLDAVGWLIAGSLLGALVYAAAAATLWWMAGRPQGVEVAVFDRLRETLRVRRARGTP
ncbi:MAG: lipopolysaccharide biosynthesis protein [Burkholderiaceae bacterium]|nr:lipopolysaccharide biosynthesis protein [Burkholderiaceae bacterium]